MNVGSSWCKANPEATGSLHAPRSGHAKTMIVFFFNATKIIASFCKVGKAGKTVCFGLQLKRKDLPFAHAYLLGKKDHRWFVVECDQLLVISTS